MSITITIDEHIDGAISEAEAIALQEAEALAKAEAEAIKEAKRLKEEALKAIKVTTVAGNVFDGDETARVDMLAAIAAAGLLGMTEHSWKLADNTWKVVTLDELKEALALAIQAKGVILAGGN